MMPSGEIPSGDETAGLKAYLADRLANSMQALKLYMGVLPVQAVRSDPLLQAAAHAVAQIESLLTELRGTGREGGRAAVAWSATPGSQRAASRPRWPAGQG
jgi:hypothetical protein